MLWNRDYYLEILYLGMNIIRYYVVAVPFNCQKRSLFRCKTRPTAIKARHTMKFYINEAVAAAVGWPTIYALSNKLYLSFKSFW